MKAEVTNTSSQKHFEAELSLEQGEGLRSMMSVVPWNVAGHGSCPCGSSSRPTAQSHNQIPAGIYTEAADTRFLCGTQGPKLH